MKNRKRKARQQKRLAYPMKNASFRRIAKRKALLRKAKALRNATRAMTAEHIKLDRFGYQKGGYNDGMYFGVGQKVYRVYDSDGNSVKVVRAKNAQSAKELAILTGPSRLSEGL